jgi:hypothetical protein
LRRRFTFPEDHFGEAMPQGAVMIQLGEAQILEGKVAHALQRGVDRQRAGMNTFQEVA